MALGQQQHLVTLDTTDGLGGVAPLTPASWFCAYRSEGQGQATFTGIYRPDITTATRVWFKGRRYQVTAADNLDGRDTHLVVHASELFD
jgi:head-tail adaptor